MTRLQHQHNGKIPNLLLLHCYSVSFLVFVLYYVSCCDYYVDGFLVIKTNNNIVPIQQLYPSSSTPSIGILPTSTKQTKTALFESTETDKNSNNDNGDIPTMDWLTDGLEREADKVRDNKKKKINGYNVDMTKAETYMEEYEGRSGDLGDDIPIPTTGVSVADEMVAATRDRFYSELVPITMGNGNSMLVCGAVDLSKNVYQL